MKFLIAFSLAAASLFGQGALSPVPIQQPLNNSGQTLIGGCLYTFLTGTTTPQATYSNATLTSANTNPIVLDASGRAPAIFLSPVSYKFVLAQKFLNACPATPGTVLWSQDPVFDSGQAVKIAILALLAAPSGSNLIGFSQSSSYSAGTVGKKLQQLVSVTDAPYSAVADGTGTAGTDQATKFQAAVDAVSAAGGGAVFIPKAALCYVIGPTPVYVPTNVTIFGEGVSSCVQKMHGNSANPVFNAGTSFGGTNTASAASSNIWFKNFTIDGNKANITGISGDGFNQGINFSGVSNGGTVGMNVENAYTGGISVICYGSPATNAGDNVQILDTNITGSRRNNFEPLCGTHSAEIGGTNTGATGGSLSLGVDAEPSAAGQFITGLRIEDVLFSGNRDGCISAQFKYDTAWRADFINNACTVPTTTDIALGVSSANTSTGTTNIQGGSYVGGATATAAIQTQQGQRVNVIGVSATGSARGLLTCSNCGAPQAGTVTTVVSSFLNGSTYDIDCFNTVSLVGVTLANSTRGAGCAPYVTAMAGGVSASWQAGCIPTFASNSGGQTNLNCAANFKADSPGGNFEYYITDGGGTPVIGKSQVIAGSSVEMGAQSAHDMCLITTNTCRVIVKSGGLGTYANNAAAIAAGVPVGGLYYITGSDSLGIVH